MDQLTLEAAEEIFCHGVIIRVAFSGHALPDSKGFQPLPKGPGSVLDASVTVKDQAFGRLTTAYRDVQSCQSQGSVDTAGKGVIHNFAGT